MFKKTKKNKEDNKTEVSTIGNTTTVTHQNNSERRLSENITQRSSLSYTSTSTSYSSVRVTRELERSSISTSRIPAINISSIFDNHSSRVTPLSNRVQPIDGTRINTSNSTLANGGGYQSTFSRKLLPLSTDAKPFTSNLQLPQRQATPQPTPTSPANFPRFSSYHPETTSSRAAGSTHSLPTCGESVAPDPRIPTYEKKNKKRGKVLVINNVKFLKEDDERKGAEIDEKDVKKLFLDMGFDVDTYRNLKMTAMMDKVNSFRKDSALKKVDISIVIMMSHGTNVDNTGTAIRGGFTQIFGTDGVGLSIDDVLDKFTTANCPAMAGKAKIFIFQCCRGASGERALHHDAAPFSQKNVIKKHADMLVAFSTLPGFFSIRDPHLGSWYIQCICDVFKKHAKDFDVETLLKIVDDQLSQKHPTQQQTSSYENRGFKRCFLHPRWCNPKRNKL